MTQPKVAILRPDDNRIAEAGQYLQSLGVSPVTDPMLTICPSGQTPRQAEYFVFTSKTGVELAVQQEWRPKGAIVCAVGQKTATELRNRGYSVDVVPSTFTSAGLIEELSDGVDGQTVEIARSAHGSDVLVRGLEAAGANVHETQLYRLDRPTTAGRSVSLATDGRLDGVLFTSPKTVDHFFEIADEKDGVAALQRGLDGTIIGVIGTPTERAVRKKGIAVDVKPDTVDFTRLADLTVRKIGDGRL